MELVGRFYSVEDYYKIAHLKTASLFSASARLGAIIGGGTSDEVNAMGQYGNDLGIAFQIRDDILDFTADKQLLGKPLLTDLKMNRPTLVLLLAMQDGLSRESMLSMSHDDLCKALMPYINEAEAIAVDRTAKAKDSLRGIRDSKAKPMLEDFCDFVIARYK